MNFNLQTFTVQFLQHYTYMYFNNNAVTINHLKCRGVNWLHLAIHI